MNTKFFKFAILLMGLSLSGVASFYSIIGLSKLFAGAKLPVIIMASLLEVAKIFIAIILHIDMKSITAWIRSYLIISIAILMIITSAGIYGFLSAAFQSTYDKDQLTVKNIELYETKRNYFKGDLNLLLDERKSLTESYNQINKGYTIQNTSVTKNGKTTSVTDNNLQKRLDKQSTQLNTRLDYVNVKYNNVSDSILKYERLILELKSKSNETSELGPLKYMAELSGKPMNIIVNWFIIALILVFDPLALILTIISVDKNKPQIEPQHNISTPDQIIPEIKETETDISTQEVKLNSKNSFDNMIDSYVEDVQLSKEQMQNMSHQEIDQIISANKYK